MNESSNFCPATSVGLGDERKLRSATKWLQDMGDILFFEKYPTLSDIIVINPTWLIYVRKSKQKKKKLLC